MAPVPLMACDVVLISTLLLDLQTREKGNEVELKMRIVNLEWDTKKER